MEEVKFAAGNITFAVRELHTRQGDGVSVDILAGEADLEVSIIRLDWFPNSPHYHYNPKRGRNPEMPLDPALIGDSMDWFLERIPDRLPAMVQSAGHPDVAKAIDPGELTRAMPDVKKAAKIARQECGAQE
ncbi:MAG: hypothetical protein ACI82H_001181 [Alphaproteobacteria bacterium]|jgi:hypothetical protein